MNFAHIIIDINNSIQPHLTISEDAKMELNMITERLLSYVIKSSEKDIFCTDNLQLVSLHKQAMLNYEQAKKCIDYKLIIELQIICYHYIPKMYPVCMLLVQCIVEYILNEIIELSGIEAENDQSKYVNSSHLKIAIEKDAELSALIKFIEY